MKNPTIAVASGKGGVGKSMMSSGLAMGFSRAMKVTAVDADVDAPNLHLWLGGVAKWDRVKKLALSEKPIIDQAKCNLCGECVKACVFDALAIENGRLRLNPYFCEGCAACAVVCPQKAVGVKKVVNAEIRVKRRIQGLRLAAAQLKPGEAGSGKVVDEIRRRAQKTKSDLTVVDAPAGTGCPVIAALNGVDYAVLVTEPTLSGFTDLKRVLSVVNHFQIAYGVVVNKWDLSPGEAKKIKQWAGGHWLGKVGYDQRIFKAIARLQPVLKTDLPVKKEIEAIRTAVNQRLEIN
jgi:MinD superfamily P-loop ATPase